MIPFEGSYGVYEIVRVFGIASISFAVAMALTPLLTHYLYKYKIGKQIRADGDTPVFTALHEKKRGTPTMGGIIIWGVVLILALLFSLLSSLTHFSIFESLDFLNRSETFLPIGLMVLAAIVGMLDDMMGVFRIGPKGGGLSMKDRMLLYLFVAVVGAYWFYFRLGWDTVHIPAFGDLTIGIWYIPLFIFIIVATSFSLNETDGLDGLAGGVVLPALAVFAAIAFMQGKTELAMFCGAIIGALLAFLWFNIPPARFFMGDTGSMALGVTLGTVAMLTDSFLILPFVGFILVIESLSVIIQLTSKKFRHKKVFLSAPIHHHFEAKGWSESKIVMRFWVISYFMCAVGLVIGLLGRGVYTF
ncbi:MAG: phospho-N-acetylmuramoyl-pentapeptide-transferase [Candidatus Pacebacteria bacterium]|jgi:phospho-N-acetylmuramoyl-pentapeptide-transferase|nr:phospho-N-acetylmuramoyl-pentapeptide-transferase [Candidatus Paceibacterota bacterium]